MAVKKILCRTPVRIDLAGGTLDLWPLYLLIPDSRTINIAIDLFAEADIKFASVSKKPGVHFQSLDQKISEDLSWQTLDQARLKLLAETLKSIIKVFPKLKLSRSEIWIRTSAKSPAGAGLGGSSALLVAVLGALSKILNLGLHQKGFELISFARDIESRLLWGPAGYQDYFGAYYGGLQVLNWNPGIPQRATLSPNIFQGLQSRLLLFYSGVSRNSGINNWKLYKNLVDREEETKKNLEGIAFASQSLEKAFQAGDWQNAGRAIQEEWQSRQKLADSLVTPEIQRAFSIFERHGVSSYKICGAGGGGCFFAFLSQPSPQLSKKIVSEVITIPGVLPLSFQLAKKGVFFGQSKAN